MSPEIRHSAAAVAALWVTQAQQGDEAEGWFRPVTILRSESCAFIVLFTNAPSVTSKLVWYPGDTSNRLDYSLERYTSIRKYVYTILLD